MIGIRKKLPAVVGCMSLIGVRGKPPYSWGNYFWINSRTGGEELRVYNMWAENLRALVEDGTLDDDMIEVIQFDSGCIVVDPRVPEEYLYNKLCFTGGLLPSQEVAREMYDLLGDPTNEFQLFTDPVAYYAKKGSSYNPETGIITTTYNKPSREIPNIKFSIEPVILQTHGLDVLEQIEADLITQILEDK